MQELRMFYTKSYLIIFFEHKSIVRPTYAIVQPEATFNLATVRAHVLESLQPNSNYFNNTKVKVPKNMICNIVNHNCNKLHSQLIRFDRICGVCVGTTANGTFANAMKLLQEEGTHQYHVYNFKDSYLPLFEEYKRNRVAVFGNYEVN